VCQRQPRGRSRLLYSWQRLLRPSSCVVRKILAFRTVTPARCTWLLSRAPLLPGFASIASLVWKRLAEKFANTRQSCCECLERSSPTLVTFCRFLLPSSGVRDSIVLEESPARDRGRKSIRYICGEICHRQNAMPRTSHSYPTLSQARRYFRPVLCPSSHVPVQYIIDMEKSFLRPCLSF
jgi:hypothetical protein